MRARRRLPVIAGMALSAVITAAPAAHADDFLSPRQDCSRTQVVRNDNDDKDDKGAAPKALSVVSQLIKLLDTAANGGDDNNNDNNNDDEVKLPERVFGDKIDVDVRDSFNCANIFDRSFRDDSRDERYFKREDRDYDHREYKGGYDHRGYDHRDRDRDHGDRDRDHGDRNHGDRNHRERTAATAPTAATAATAATAPTARVARRFR